MSSLVTKSASPLGSTTITYCTNLPGGKKRIIKYQYTQNVSFVSSPPQFIGEPVDKAIDDLTNYD